MKRLGSRGMQHAGLMVHRVEVRDMSDLLVPRVGGVLSADIAVPEHEREVRFYSRILSTGKKPGGGSLSRARRESGAAIGLDDLPSGWRPRRESPSGRRGRRQDPAGVTGHGR